MRVMDETGRILGAAFRRIVKDGIVAPLAPHGFKRWRDGVARETGAVVHLVTAFKRPRFYFDPTDFTVECGVFVPGLWEIEPGGKEIAQARIPASSIRESLGLLGPERRDIRWPITLATLDADVAGAIADLATRTVRDALPWLAQFPDIRSVAATLTKGAETGGPMYWFFGPSIAMRVGAAAYLLAGDLDAARFWAVRARTAYHQPGTKAYLEQNSDRLLAIIDAVARGEPMPRLPPVPIPPMPRRQTKR